MFNEASLSELYTNDLHTSKLIISYIMQAHAYGHKRKSGGAGFDIILRFFVEPLVFNVSIICIHDTFTELPQD